MAGTAQTLVEKPHRAWVPGFPIVHPGVFVSYIGDCFVVLVGEQMTSVGFDAYMAGVTQAIVGSPDALRVGSIIHVNSGPWWNSLSIGQKAERMKTYADIINANREKVKTTVPVSAQIFVSAVARAAVRTALVFSPPPSPSFVAKTAEEAYRLMARTYPPLQAQAEDLLAAHEYAVNKYVPDLMPSLRRG